MNTQLSSIATPLSILAAGFVLMLLMMFGGSSPDFSSSVNAYPVGEPTTIVATPTAGIPVQPTARPGQPSPTPWPTTIICGALHRQPEPPLAAYPIGKPGKPNAAGQCLPFLSK